MCEYAVAVDMYSIAPLPQNPPKPYTAVRETVEPARPADKRAQKGAAQHSTAASSVGSSRRKMLRSPCFDRQVPAISALHVIFPHIPAIQSQPQRRLESRQASLASVGCAVPALTVSSGERVRQPLAGANRRHYSVGEPAAADLCYLPGSVAVGSSRLYGWHYSWPQPKVPALGWREASLVVVAFRGYSR